MNQAFNENKLLVSPSLLMEYWYCPRFIYFMEVLKIRQYEEKRLKVLLGREVHEKKALQPEYLRKKLGVIRQEKDIYLSAPEQGICGILDEILFFGDGTVAPLDYKFAYEKHKFKTQFLQNVLYAMLIEANYRLPVNACYIVYTREKNEPVRYPISRQDRDRVSDTVQKIERIISGGYYPPATSHKKSCGDCTYRKICVQ